MNRKSEIRRKRAFQGKEVVPEQCLAELKPLGSARNQRCSDPAMPGESYCPLHLILSRRILERAERYRKLGEFYRQEVSNALHHG